MSGKFSSGTIRNLLFHIAPFEHNRRWRWHVREVRRRLGLFNGRRVIATVYGANLASPEVVQAAFGAADRVEFLVMPNDPARWDSTTLEALLGCVETLDPRHVTLRAHAKGVRYAPGHPRYALTRQWCDMLYETYLDHWPLVERMHKHRAVAGSFKRLGQAWAEHQSLSDWHYSGAWFWFRNRDLFAKPDWRRHDRFSGAAESYPSLHFGPDEAACIFHETNAHGEYMYDPNIVRPLVQPAPARWRAQHRADALAWPATEHYHHLSEVGSPWEGRKAIHIQRRENIPHVEAPSVMTDIDLLAAIVRGDRDMTASLSSIDAEAFCRGAAEHGVLPLVADRLTQAEHVPAALRTLLRRRATAALVVDLARVAELKRLLSALASGGVSPLLLKGAHLAYSHYARPYLRPKPDTDLLVPQCARDAVRHIVLDLGYEPCPAIPGEFVAAQATFEKSRGGRLVHTVDVHWKISNALPFSDVLTYDELADRAVAVPSLDPLALGLSSVDALVLAAVHRIAHHFDSDHLIWLYDIDLIARGLTHEEWRQFTALVRARKVATVCRRSLQRAVDRFGTNIPAWVWTDLPSRDAAEGERTARYLDRRTHLGVVLDDLRTLSRWRDRWRLVREHAFPPATYMRGVYGPSSAAPLPLLYARRLLRGGRKWLKKQV